MYNPIHFTMPYGAFDGCASPSCNCNCNNNGTGYAPNDPRSQEPTAQSLSVGDSNTSVVNSGSVIPISNSYSTSGTHITGINPFILRAGHKYKVEFVLIGFSAAATNPFGGKLQLNGVDVPGSAAALSSLATSLCITGNAIVSTQGQTNDGNLTLVGVSTTSATYQYKSVVIVEVE